MFRPEDTTVVTSAGDNALACRIERLSFQGGITECQVSVGTAALRSMLHGTDVPERGAAAWLRVRDGRCLIFRNGGR